jgi:hypothetical protein
VIDPLTASIFIIFSLITGSAATTVVLKWEDIKFALDGKKIAVLGARAVGKTTLLTYLEKGILIEKYKQTLDRQEVERTRIKLSALDIRLKKTDDVSGDQSAYAAWKDLFDTSDLIFYIVRTDKLLKRDSTTEKRCEDDLKQIHGWIKSNSKQQIFIIGNHWDDDPEFKNLTDDIMGNYIDRFSALSVVKHMTQLAGGLHTVKVALGSLATQRDADNLITRIFHQVKK